MVASHCTAGALRSLRLAVRTLASHAGNRGSIPLGSATHTPAYFCFPLNIAGLSGFYLLIFELVLQGTRIVDMKLLVAGVS